MVEEWQMILAKQIRCKMVAHDDMKKKELAKQIGVSPAVVGQYIRCRTKPSVDILIRIANAFGCTIDELLHNDD